MCYDKFKTIEDLNVKIKEKKIKKRVDLLLFNWRKGLIILG